MMALMKSLLAFALVLSGGRVLFAATYYVSKSGSDSNTGSQASPWLTVQKAAGAVKAGDIVNLGPGTYDESVSISRSGTVAAGITFTGPATVRQFNVNGSYVTLTNLSIGTTNVSAAGVQLGGAGDVVAGCSFNLYSNAFAAVTFTGSGCIASNCDLTGVSQSAVITFWTNSANCLAVACGIHDMHDVDALHVWGVSNFMRGCTVYNLDNPNVAVWHADFAQIYGDNGESGSFNVVENNYVHDCACQIGNFTTDIGDLHDITFRNNVFVNITRSAYIGIRNFFWFNNIFYQCSTVEGDVLIFYQMPAYDSTGAQVVNNIFLQCGSNPGNTGQGTVGEDGQDLTTLNISYNYFGGAGFAAKNGGYTGTHAVNGGDPKLANISAYDFHLLTNSPLIGAGTNLSQYFAKDRDGNARPAMGNWDIGPYQFGSVSPPPPLSINRSAANVILTWATGGSATLEFATNLVSPVVWSTNLPAPVVTNGQNNVTNAVTGSKRFYRLFQ
jgi:Protein of unknown function (DUF1565)